MIGRQFRSKVPKCAFSSNWMTVSAFFMCYQISSSLVPCFLSNAIWRLQQLWKLQGNTCLEQKLGCIQKSNVFFFRVWLRVNIGIRAWIFCCCVYWWIFFWGLSTWCCIVLGWGKMVSQQKDPEKKSFAKALCGCGCHICRTFMDSWWLEHAYHQSYLQLILVQSLERDTLNKAILTF